MLQGAVSLTIMGNALGKSQEATSVVAKFINSLKTNKNFSRYFDEVELENMNSGSVAGEEVMIFKLECESKAKKKNKNMTTTGTKDKRKSKRRK